MTDQTQVRLSVVNLVIAALLSALMASGGVIWSQQRQEISDQRKELSTMRLEIGMLQNADNLSMQDRAVIRDRLRVVEARQQQVIGVLSTLNPKATSLILENGNGVK